MAFTDFDILATQATVLHSVAPLTTNPLSASLAGGYCRSMAFSGSYAPKIYFKSSAYSSAFYNVPNTKVISARAYLRKTTANSTHVLVVKDSTTYNSTTGISGYGFGMGQNGGADDCILFANDGSVLAYAPSIFANNTWYSLRMDVFPLGTLADRIICYLETSPGSGIWNSTIGSVLFDITVSSTDPKYAPWSSNSMNGISSRGFGTPNANVNYVDNINFTVYTAP